MPDSPAAAVVLHMLHAFLVRTGQGAPTASPLAGRWLAPVIPERDPLNIPMPAWAPSSRQRLQCCFPVELWATSVALPVAAMESGRTIASDQAWRATLTAHAVGPCSVTIPWTPWPGHEDRR